MARNLLSPVTTIHKPGIAFTRFRMRVSAENVRELFADYERMEGGAIWVFDCSAVENFGSGVLNESFLGYERAPKFGLRYAIVIAPSEKVKMATSSIRETVHSMNGIEIHMVDTKEQAFALADELASSLPVEMTPRYFATPAKPESVDQALCFGWIDGIRKSVDEERYVIRFTPRKRTSIRSDEGLRPEGLNDAVYVGAEDA